MKGKFGMIMAFILLCLCSGNYAQFNFSNTPVWLVQGNYPTGLGWNDFDGNGYPDVAVSMGLDIVNGPTMIYYNNEGIISTIPGWTSGYQAPGCQLYTGDFDHNGYPDISVASLGLTSTGLAPVPNYLFMNDNGMPSWPGWLSQPGNSFSCSGGDINGDGYIDLAFSRGDYATQKKQQAILFLNAGGVFDSIPDWYSDSAYYGTDVAFADVDLDGDLDMVLGARTKGVMLFYSQNGILETSPSWNSHQVSGGRQIAFGDVDNDGYPDLAVAAPGSKFYLFKNINGVLDTIPFWASVKGNEPSAVAWADADGDGDLDLAAGSWNGALGIFENTGGSLADTFAWSKSIGSGTQQIAWIDYKNDVLIDTVKIFHGDGLRKVFYTGKQPLQRIVSIEKNGAVLPGNQYCYDLTCGWISFSFPPSASDTIVIHYSFSLAPDLSVTNYSSAKLYENLNTSSAVMQHFRNPDRPVLDQNIPNPCCEITTIRFSLHRKDKVSIKLYDSMGKEIRTCLQAPLGAGDHSLTVCTDDLRRGLYTYILSVNGFIESRKMIVQ